jgi:hypothetical protein
VVKRTRLEDSPRLATGFLLKSNSQLPGCGQAISLQMRSLERGIDVVVGTPGRVIVLLALATS